MILIAIMEEVNTLLTVTLTTSLYCREANLMTARKRDRSDN